MKYDLTELDDRVLRKRKRFIAYSTAVGVIAIACIILISLSLDRGVSFACGFVLLLLAIIEIVLIKAFSVPTLFSKAIEGRNIKEHEWGIQGDGQPRIFYRWGNMPHTFSNKKIPPRKLRGTVYLELDDGNIKQITGLYKSHMDIYVEGDRLLKPRGVRIPIVVGREVEEQPCPLCAEVNKRGDTRCRGCGLGIINEP